MGDLKGVKVKQLMCVSTVTCTRPTLTLTLCVFRHASAPLTLTGYAMRKTDGSVEEVC